jgi:hypothetical protein
MSTSAPSAALPESARTRLADLEAQARAEPAAVARLFPAVGRLVGRGVLPGAAPNDPAPVTVEDVARAGLLGAARDGLGGDGAVLAVLVDTLYRDGDADEKRAVLRALPGLDLGPAAVPLVADALRTNDVRLVAVAMGPYAAQHLDDSAWRHGVLKCLFTGVPVDVVADLERRTDVELLRMVRGFADERRAAGRAVPADVDRILRARPAAT